MTIRGTASIKQYHILNDKRFIVTKDTDENVCVWDVLQARKTESLGKENFDQAIKVSNNPSLIVFFCETNQNYRISAKFREYLKELINFIKLLLTLFKKRCVNDLLAYPIGSRST